MSDPTFWTPPNSPKFVGQTIGTFEDGEDGDVDLFFDNNGKHMFYEGSYTVQDQSQQTIDLIGLNCESSVGLSAFLKCVVTLFLNHQIS